MRTRFKEENPIIPGGAVDKDKNIMSAANGWDVVESNIHMNLIQIAVGDAINGLSGRHLGNSSIGAEGHGKFAGGDKVAIKSEGEKILVVIEPTTPRNPV